ncbi:MAG: hypothetical protein KIT80_10770 [Chitinophagaceae bacterium]|nr:hypothetical protein [Chitinophagaceae bacterium]MCW5927385.1 hypothetical protein [Chitinophagaceae bacterium]
MNFDKYDITATTKEFVETALQSGLINASYPEDVFRISFSIRVNTIRLKDKRQDERLTQVIADYLRKKMLTDKKRFSFETVFPILPSCTLCVRHRI